MQFWANLGMLFQKGIFYYWGQRRGLTIKEMRQKKKTKIKERKERKNEEYNEEWKGTLE